MNTLRDEELVAQTLGGDPEAFGALYDRHFPFLYRFAMKRTAGNVHEAEELVSRAFEKALKALPSFRGECVFAGWLVTILRRLIYDWSEARAAREIASETLEPSTGSHDGEVDARLDRDQVLAYLQGCVSELKDRDQRLFHHIAVQGRNQKDVAELFEMDHAACRKAYERLRKRVADCLQRKQEAAIERRLQLQA